MAEVLFVCTGNIFRSVSAERLMRRDLEAGAESLHKAFSAGTEAWPQEMIWFVRDEILQLGGNPEGHIQRRVDQEIIDSADLVVAMGLDHQDFLKEAFGLKVPLFNEVCGLGPVPMPDIWETVPKWEEDLVASEEYARSVIRHISNNMERFIAGISDFTGTRASPLRA